MIGLSTPINTLLLQNLLLQLVVGAVYRAGVCGLAVRICVARTIVRHGSHVIAGPLVAVL